MTFPIINKIYAYENEKVIVWGQDMFIKVYFRTISEDGKSIYKTANWWKFIFKAKYIDRLRNNENY